MVFAEDGMTKERLHMNSIICYLDVALMEAIGKGRLYFVDVAEED